MSRTRALLLAIALGALTWVTGMTIENLVINHARAASVQH